MENIVQALRMSSTAPGIPRDVFIRGIGSDTGLLAFYDTAMVRLSKPYETDSLGRIRKSDAGHAFDHWDSLPPEDFYRGIGIWNTKP